MSAQSDASRHGVEPTGYQSGVTWLDVACAWGAVAVLAVVGLLL